jgi:hypothetical protein
MAPLRQHLAGVQAKHKYQIAFHRVTNHPLRGGSAQATVSLSTSPQGRVDQKGLRETGPTLQQGTRCLPPPYRRKRPCVNRGPSESNRHSPLNNWTLIHRRDRGNHPTSGLSVRSLGNPESRREGFGGRSSSRSNVFKTSTRVVFPIREQSF